MGLTAFLPCRVGSERVPEKNTRWFAGTKLFSIKLNQLAAAESIDRIVVSTNDPWIHEQAAHYDKTVVHWRDASLCESSTSTDELIRHAADLITDGDILWTHCTSPFVTAALYDEMVAAYRTPGEHDSLMAAHLERGFFWFHDLPMPINYGRWDERWPRTQTVRPIYKVTSGAFIAPAEFYRLGDRIGKSPLMFELDDTAAIDIDTQSEFDLAEHLLLSGYAAT